ncbi:unnamed protein product [Discula destructiva]
MSGLKVLVVGASIAGPTTAYWLAKAGAADVTVIERFPDLRTSGQNIDLRSCGLTVMRRTPGMEDAVRAAKLDMDGVSFVDERGRPLAVMKSTGPDSDGQFLVSEYEIYRGDLARVLVDLSKHSDKVRYVFGEQIASMQQQQGGSGGPVTVQFANGRLPTADYDLVVACDGATSRTRAMGFGCGVRDYINPINAWAAYVDVKQDLLHGSKVGIGYSRPGGRTTFAMSCGPSRGGSKVMFLSRLSSAGIAKGEEDLTKPFRDAAKQGDHVLKAYVAELFSGPGWKAHEMLDEMWKSDGFYASEWFQVKLPRLYKGAFVVVGDAGYAAGPTGGGTSLAMAGAYVLAGELSRHKGDLAAGLQAYEERMRPIIDDLQQIPRGVLSFMAPQTAWGIWVRNQIFKLVCWGMKFKGLFAWTSKFFASSFGADQYHIPVYEFPG